jgi:methyltransferase-like protein/SAM-dependent methyltransferase
MTGQTSYDVVPYPGYPRPQSHPDWLATRARLFGLEPPPIETCRVLELGCADGGNLISIGFSLPGSRCVGIDLSSRQIADGHDVLAAVGIENVELRQMSILDVDRELGQFDYIISHGVFSWVGHDVQEKIFEICRHNLAPAGVAFLSYNTYPGWHLREMIRDLMWYHLRLITDPVRRLVGARQILAALIASIPAQQGGYCQFLREEQALLERAGDAYLYHEHLEDENRPTYFHEFTRRASEHGLQFLCEAEVGAMAIGRFPQPLAEAATALDVVSREQYLDFLLHRMFRQTLLCHEAVAVNHILAAERLESLWIASPATCTSQIPDPGSNQAEAFAGPGGLSVNVAHPLSKAALLYLARIWPKAVSIETLRAEARTMLSGLPAAVEDPDQFARDDQQLNETLRAAFTADVVQLYARPLAFACEVSDRPEANRLARWQAAQGRTVTTLRHDSRTFDPMTYHLIAHLDGQRDRGQLVELLVQYIGRNGIVLQRDGRPVDDPNQLRALIAEELEPNLRNFAAAGLLVA